MSKKKKILILALVLVLGGGYVAKGMLMPPKKVKDKINGSIYILPGQFLVNLTDSRYGKVTVALVLAPGQSTGAAAAGSGTAPPDGFGTLPEEAAVRDIITNILTDQSSHTLISPPGREKLKHKILTGIQTGTDVKVSDVLFTDVAVQ
jgi:flagellar basal body-associated protein FliL